MKKLFKKEELLRIVYKINGILNYGNDKETGELYVISKILPKYIPNQNSIIFDVGANVGNYSDLLEKYFNKSLIYSFEPNINAFNKLRGRFPSGIVKTYNMGLGSKLGNNTLFSFSELNRTELGTCNEEAIRASIEGDIKDTIEKIDFEMTTIDLFCKQNAIEKIDFLKIDVEGYELEVIKGAKGMIKDGNIAIIQFEFNKMNVWSKVFLKDFYEALLDYEMFRIKKGELIPLGKYDTINEIFKYQNVLAINKYIYENIHYTS